MLDPNKKTPISEMFYDRHFTANSVGHGNLPRLRSARASRPSQVIGNFTK